MWKFVEGTNNRYIITSTGRVFRRRYLTYRYPERGLKPFEEVIPCKSSSGYLQIGIQGKGVPVHRLVAEAFIPHTLQKNEVDHIDGNKENNTLENLRWVSHSENCSNPVTLQKEIFQGYWTNIVAVSKKTGKILHFKDLKEVGKFLAKRGTGKGWGTPLVRCMRMQGGYAYGHYWTGSFQPR